MYRRTVDLEKNCVVTDMKKAIPVFHLISSTGIGGAEMMLERFLKHHEPVGTSLVISLTTIDAIGERLLSSGVPVVALNIHSPLSAIVGLYRYLRLARAYRPKSIIGWMYHANLLAAVCSIVTPGSRIVWNVRCSLSQYVSRGLLKRSVLWFSRVVAGFPDRIVFNSHRSMEEHIKYGFPKNKCEVIYNGFDPAGYCLTDTTLKRSAIGLHESKFLIGCFGRNVPVKRMTDMLQVCAELQARQCPAELLFIGRNFDSTEFQEAIRSSGVEHSIHVIQEVPSLTPYYDMIDAFCLCSESEGFPNVIGEAVYNGVPVFCTDVGDMRRGFLSDWQVSPVGDIQSLVRSALCIYKMSSGERMALVNNQREVFRGRTEMSCVINKFSHAFFVHNHR